MPTFIEALPFIGIDIAYAVLFQWVFNRLTPYNDRDVKLSGNKAARLTRQGATLGYLIAIQGTLLNHFASQTARVETFALDGVVAMAVFALMYYAVDAAVLRHVHNDVEIAKGNRAVAMVEASAYVALGLVMNASFGGGGDPTLVAGLASAALFSAIGMVTVLLVYTVYTIGWKLRGCGLDEQVRLGNRAAAVEAGSLLLAISISLWFSIIGDFTGWVHDIVTYAEAAAYSVAAVMVGRSLVSLLTHGLGRTKKGVHHGSMKKAVIVGMVSIACGIGMGVYTLFG